jgi:hypothetical protein
MTEQIHSVPVPVIKGRFNVYETPDKGFHIAYIRDGEDEIQHIELPGVMINAARMMSEGKLNPLQLFRMISGKADA